VKQYSLIAVASVFASISISWLAIELDLPNGWIVGMPTLAAVYTFLYWLVDRHVWRSRALRRIGVFSDFPIDGQYRGEIISSFNGTTHPVMVTIDQTWTKILIQLEVTGARTSSSYSISANCVDVNDNGDVKLEYKYRNNPNPGVADEDMAMHDGSVELTIRCNGRASGTYFNSRERTGTIMLERQTRNTSTV